MYRSGISYLKNGLEEEIIFLTKVALFICVQLKRKGYLKGSLPLDKEPPSVPVDQSTQSLCVHVLGQWQHGEISSRVLTPGNLT